MPISDYIRKMRAFIGHDVLVLVGCAAGIRRVDGAILLQRRSDNGLWGLPAGSCEPGEDPAATIIREVREETGLEVIPERIVGVYGGPDHVLTYPTGDRVALTSICFECRITGGAVSEGDDETLELRWFAPEALPDTLMPHHRLRITHALSRTTPYFRVPGQDES